MGYIYLVGAIISEVFGSTMLKLTSVSVKKGPLIGVIFGYLIAFYLLSLALLTIPLSFSYAVWSGVGTALTAIIGFLIFKEQINKNIVIGICLLVIGIIMMRM